jgi:hypothetical protein
MAENKAVVNDIPFTIGQNVVEALSRYDRSEFAADYAIGNQPWLSAASNDRPSVRSTTTYQKERVDQEASAGENTLSNWWLRSATSWHKGEGITFYDPSGAPVETTSDLYRYSESSNVDVWTEGQLKLLPRAASVTACATSYPATASAGTWFIQDNKVWLFTASANTAASVSAFVATAQVLTSDGTDALVGATNGIYRVKPDGSVSQLWYPLSGSASTWTCQAIGFIKERIMVGASVPATSSSAAIHIFELAASTNSASTVTASAHSKWSTTQNTVKVRTFSESTAAILAGYNNGVVSRVLSFTVDTTSGGLGALQTPIQVAEYPRGETLNQLRTYLTTFVVSATNKGVRVGVVNQSGLGFIYGPLIVEGECKDLAFTDSYVYATRVVSRAGAKGLWRIDLSTDVDGSYAYASDLNTDANDVTGVAFVGETGRPFVTTNAGSWYQHPSLLAQTGYLKSGLIRYGTTEDKQIVSTQVRSDNNQGQVGLVIRDAVGNATTINSIPIGTALNIPMSQALRPSSEYEIEILLTSNNAGDDCPILEEWQVRVLPAPVRSRTITLPVLCFGEELDANGVTRVSVPYERLRAMEILEQTGGAVLYQDFSNDEERLCVIRAVQYEQDSPPSFENGFGGIVTIQLQTVDPEFE